MAMLLTAVERDPQPVSGALVFRGTRIPVVALFENLEDGIPLAEFVERFPGVTQAQARSVQAAQKTMREGREIAEVVPGYHQSTFAITQDQVAGLTDNLVAELEENTNSLLIG